MSEFDNSTTCEIDLSKFLQLLGYNKPRECYFYEDCHIDDTGIRAKKLTEHEESLLIGDEWEVRKEYERDIRLDFPCTYQAFKAWADRIGIMIEEIMPHHKRPAVENLEANDLIPYLKARQILKDRLNATEHEIAMWIFWGGTQGGIDAFITDGKGRHHRFCYSPGSNDNDDYLSVLVNLNFKSHDIEAFKPTTRFITRAELVKRWSALFGSEKSAQSLIATEKGKGLRSVDGENFWPVHGLLELHPITGLANISVERKLPGLFNLNEIERIENERGFSPNKPNIHELQQRLLHESRDEAKQNNQAIKERKCKNENEALILLYAALDELEAKDGKTPSWTELAAYVLSDSFKHTNIQEYAYEEGALIKNRRLILSNGTILDRMGIKKRYNETIYPKEP